MRMSKCACIIVTANASPIFSYIFLSFSYKKDAEGDKSNNRVKVDHKDQDFHQNSQLLVTSIVSSNNKTTNTKTSNGQAFQRNNSTEANDYMWNTLHRETSERYE